MASSVAILAYAKEKMPWEPFGVGAVESSFAPIPVSNISCTVQRPTASGSESGCGKKKNLEPIPTIGPIRESVRDDGSVTIWIIGKNGENRVHLWEVLQRWTRYSLILLLYQGLVLFWVLVKMV